MTRVARGAASYGVDIELLMGACSGGCGPLITLSSFLGSVSALRLPNILVCTVDISIYTISPRTVPGWYLADRWRWRVSVDRS